MSNKKKINGYGCLKCLLIIISSLVGLLILFSIINADYYCIIGCGYHRYKYEAKVYISTINRGQEVYFNQNNTFADSIEKLKIGISTETKHHSYSMQVNKDNCLNYAISKNKRIKSYVGGVFIISEQSINPNFQEKSKKTTSIICESLAPNLTNINPPQLINNKLVCGLGTKEL